MENKNTANQKPGAALQPQVSVIEIIRTCLSKWYWFVLSVVVCLGLGVLKYLKATPVYERTATLIIKEATNRRIVNSELDNVITGSGFMGSSSKLVNEIVSFQSPALMQSVVERLGLNVEYYKPGLFHDNLLYGSGCPIDVKFIDVNFSSGLKFELEPSGSGYVIPIMTYSVEREKYTVKDASTVHSFGDTVSTPVGRFVVALPFVQTALFDHPVIVRTTSVRAAAGKFLSSFSAKELDLKNRSDVLSLTLHDINTSRAEDIINMVIAVYNENWVADRNAAAKNSSSFIKDRLSSLESDLNNVDNEISAYKSSNLIPDINAVSNLYMTQSAESYRLIQDLDNQLSVSKYIRVMLSNVNQKKDLIPMAASVGSAAISTQINEYNKALLTRNGLVASSSEENPLVGDMDKNLDAMRRAISSAIDNQITSLEAQIKNIGANAAKTTSRIAESPSQAKYLLKVGRQQKVMESLYLFLLQKREENELSQAFTAYNTKIITPPMGSSVPVSPQSAKILMVAFLLGLCIPVAVIYIVLVLDTTVHSKKDFIYSEVPFLSEVPLATPPDGVKSDMPFVVVENGKRDIVNESFRVLRTNLEFMLQNGGKVMLFTSFNSGSGKSFLAINLALAFAMKNKKVLLIDGDLRHASVSGFANGHHKTNGLADYLAGKDNEWESLLTKSVAGNPNFDLFAVGTIPPNPSELVGESKFATIVKEAREKYDYIFIDCPPVDIVADTQIISPLADRTIFVARSGLFKKDMVDALNSMYSEGRFKDMCLVLNGTDMNSPRYSYPYGYKYGYAYKGGGRVKNKNA